ncbi:ltv1-like protein [Plakobranchus ocellatus]|uniref:Protein LTV1 homolog n=1 Tax=Plakobranchus ocellatus TaxID=259542 RepID=A0AAV3XUB0_9GAST|nr:ltv1-like protein [Plakobranchus ocellatus]
MPKPVRRKKKFISKRESTTYQLVSGFVEDDDNETPEEIAARKEEERKYGVFYDDDYNYMKHLRSLNEQATMVNTEKYHVNAEDETRSVTSDLPMFFEMFSTDVKTGESIDPEVLAALDEAPAVTLKEDELDGEAVGGSSDLDSFLDDDFISKAGGILPKPEPLDEMEDEEWSDEEEDECSDGLDDSDFGVSGEDDEDMESENLPEFHQGDSRGTVQDDIAEAQTALILRNFEEGLGFHYSNQVPDLEPEVPTEIDYEHLKYILLQDSRKAEPASWSEVLDDRHARAKVNTSNYLYEDEDEVVWKDAPKPKLKFDCVSILSLNSNTRNRPTDILPPSTKSKKSQNSEASDDQSSMDPANRGLSLRELEQEMRESRRADRADTFRPQGESMDEKRARKKAVKEERKERRQEKKANKLVFSMESEKMKRETASLAKSVKSVKIS